MKNRNEKKQETMMFKVKDESRNTVPFDVIMAAASGDTEAMMKIVNHYSGYIRKLSLRRVENAYDVGGQPIYYVDEVLQKRLEIALVMAMTKRFSIA